MHDRASGQTTRASVDSHNVQATGVSSTPAISANGRFVTFVSDATALVVGDTNGKRNGMEARESARPCSESTTGTGIKSPILSRALLPPLPVPDSVLLDLVIDRATG